MSALDAPGSPTDHHEMAPGAALRAAGKRCSAGIPHRAQGPALTGRVGMLS